MFSELLRNICFLTVVMGSILAIFLPEYSGHILFLCGLYSLVFGAKLLTVVLGALCVPLSQALIYFISDISRFRFINPSLESLHMLGLITICIIFVVVIIDFKYGNYVSSEIRMTAALPMLPRMIFFPLSGIFLLILFSVSRATMPVWSLTYDVFLQNRYGFLEYLGLMVIALHCSIRPHERFRTTLLKLLILGATLFLLSRGFRMAGVLLVLSWLAVELNMRTLKRSFFVASCIVGFLVLNAIGTLRFGYLPEFSNLVGIQSDNLDNTFTGVIETSLMYMEQSGKIALFEKMYQLLGVIVPIPYTFLPDDINFANVVYDEYWQVPGGGTLGGFFNYFGFVPGAMAFMILFTAYKYESSNVIYGPLMVILIFTAPRWFLYSPHVIFKFIILWTFFVIFTVLFLSKIKRLKLRGID